MFVGAIIVTFNIKVLGGDISFFQSVAILGYCLFPIFLGIIIVKILRFFQIRINLVSILIIAFSVLWSIICKMCNYVSIEGIRGGQCAIK